MFHRWLPAIVLTLMFASSSAGAGPLLVGMAGGPSTNGGTGFMRAEPRGTLPRPRSHGDRASQPASIGATGADHDLGWLLVTERTDLELIATGPLVVLGIWLIWRSKRRASAQEAEKTLPPD